MIGLSRLLFVILTLLSSAIFAASNTSNLKLTTDQQKVSYTLGIDIGHNIQQSFLQQGISVDPTTFAAGVADVLNKEVPQLSPQEMQSVMASFQQKMQAKSEQQARKMIVANNSALFSSSSPVDGNSTSNTTLIEFFDYQCVHCRRMAPIVKQLMQQDPQLRVVYKEFPIFGKQSVYASSMALAAAKQGKYDAFHDALMASHHQLSKDKIFKIAKKVGLNTKQLKKDMKDPAIAQQIKDNQILADKLGIVGTPAFIIGDKRAAADNKMPSYLVPGATAGNVLKELIQKVQNYQAKKGQEFHFPVTQDPNEVPGTWKGV